MADTKQLTVRVPADLVDWLDGEVARGRYPSRAAGVSRALRRGKRAQEDEQDLAKYIATPETEDERSLREWSATRAYPNMDDPDADLTEAAANLGIDLTASADAQAG